MPLVAPGRFLISAAAVVVLLAGLRAAAELIVPFLLAAFLAALCAPPLFWLKAKGLSNALAVTVVAVMLLLIGLAIAMLLGSSIQQFTQALPGYEAKLHVLTASLLTQLERFGIDLPEASLLTYIDPGAAMRITGDLLTGLGGMLANAFLILLTVLFMLFEAAGLPAKLAAAGGEQAIVHGRRASESIYHYLGIKTLLSLITGLAIGVWLALMKVDFAVLWGLLAFVLNFIPTIGSILAAVPAVLLALVQLGPGAALLALVGYIVVNVLIGNILEPRMMGQRLGLSALVVFLSLVFWGWLWGPVGMLLSVPLTMIVKILLEGSERTRAIALLLGPAPHEGRKDEVETSSA